MTEHSPTPWETRMERVMRTVAYLGSVDPERHPQRAAQVMVDAMGIIKTLMAMQFDEADLSARIAALEADLAEAVGALRELYGFADKYCGGPALKRADAILARLGQSEESP